MLRSTLCLLLLLGWTTKMLQAQTICDGTLGNNLIVNGDFGSGPASIVSADPLLAPGYLYQTSPPPDDGFYTIASTTDFGNPDWCWINTSDNSADPNGYMMVVNASFEPGIFFEQMVEVCDGIDYLFSADLINIMRDTCLGTIFPNVDFLIDGEVVFSTGDVPQDESWHTYGTLYTASPGTDFVTISLRNNAPGGGGNDLALDNISLRHCGPELVLPTLTIYCQGSPASIQANGVAEVYPNPYYQWQQSFDGGVSWEDVDGANAANLTINNPFVGAQFRVLAANGPINFLQESCRVASTATLLEMASPVEFYQTPTICAGDTVFVGDQALTQAGEYMTIIPGDSGCDSIVFTFLFEYASYDQLYTLNLCPGDVFQGQTFLSDTLWTQSFTTIDGCDSLVNYEIDIINSADLLITGNTQLCAGEETELYAPGGYSGYLWNTGEASPTITTASPGLYAVTMTNSAGCELTASVEVNLSMPVVDVSLSDPNCPGTEDGQIEVLVQGGGMEPYLFNLNGGAWQISPQFTDLAAGDYQIGIQDAFGCEGEVSAMLTDTEPFSIALEGLPSEPVDIGDTLFLAIASDADSLVYNWSGEGLFACKECATTTWVPFGEGQLLVTVSSLAGCTQELEAQVELRDPYRVYVPTAFSPNGDDINDHFAPGLGSNVQQVISWEIYDRWGGRLFAAENVDPNDPILAWDGQWRSQPMDTGVYLYRAEVEFVNGRTKQLMGEVTLVR